MIPRAEIEFTKAMAEKGLRSETPPEVMAELCRVYLASQWQPIESAPRERTPMIVVRGILSSGYLTDPWCVWWDGEWVRWPHEEQPTMWMALPEVVDERG